MDIEKPTLAQFEIQSELDLARHLANCGARPVLEALQAVERGESVGAVLRDFARLPSGCDRPRLSGAAEIVAMGGDWRGR
ncbi:MULTISPECIES: hypothetical protein [Rhizobium]|uniref:hypothetical protein n=1 Tax=Rhizobium TaxID=379 RepID=UPI00103024E5|nr:MULTISPECIES: hypothetical protein [Rhizobium]NEI28476.1 hypothetical protein [Rhizobium ruizarguesonis]NKL64999.1 hypothetical protein [Rhizobium leguminosarum bv. viciae]TBA81193.1 hypothetical protein ELH56_13565 [Rhizobium ruizarguesonis]TBZ64509.1 hypothetical protein E0H43_32825 [Rhizobium leguminosarum bv. viciae]